MSLDPNWVLVGLGVASLLGGGAVAMVSVGRHGQRLADLETARREDREATKLTCDELKDRVAAAETAAGAVKGLALAIENMGERFSLEVKHLVEKVGLETGHIREQLTDLKEEVRRRRPVQRKRVQG